MNYSIAVQLHTLREETEQDFIGTLEKVAEIGYQGVEFYQYGGLTAAELKQQLDRIGLKAAASHIQLEELKTNIDEIIEYNIQIGCDYIVVPWTNYQEKDQYVELARLCNEFGAKCKARGIQLCYHNHHREFKVFDGEYALDLFFSLTEAEKVQAEIDVYWVKYSGVDPSQYLKKYSGRCPLVHLKDMEDTEERFFAEVGSGTLDVKGVVATAEEIGAKWLIVEQDRCRRPALESVTISFNNLKKMGLVG